MTLLGFDIRTTIVRIPEDRFDTTATTKESQSVSCEGQSGMSDKEGSDSQDIGHRGLFFYRLSRTGRPRWPSQEWVVRAVTDWVRSLASGLRACPGSGRRHWLGNNR